MSEMPYNVKHYVKSDGEEKWQVVRTGNKIPSRSFDEKTDAVEYAREKAEEKGVRLTVHRENGAVHHTTDY